MIRDELADPSTPDYEYGAVLVNNPDGSVGAHDGGIHTNFSRTHASLSAPQDRSTIVATVHNHVYASTTSQANGRNTVSYNAEQRYPSPQDWDNLEAQVSRGADPNNLSVFILDGFGTLREFKYADKDKYESQTEQQRVNGEDLPEPTSGCPVP